MSIIKMAFRPIGKILCVILSVTMLLQAIPAAAFSLSRRSAAETLQAEPTASNNEATILYEITDGREAAVKKFFQNDGSYLAVSYAQPVHFETAAGWEEYDNRLEKGENGFYTVKKSDKGVRVAENSVGETLFSLTEGDHTLAWRYVGVKESSLELIEKDEKLEGDDRFLVLPNLTQEGFYRDLYKETDLQFFLSSVGIKENLILKSPDAPSEWLLCYEKENLTAAEKENGTIIFSDPDGNEIFNFSAPFMQDAEGAYGNLSFQIEEGEGEGVRIRLTADAEWLSEEGRAWPVKVDPVIVTSQAFGACSSGFVVQHNPNTAYPNCGSLYMGYENTGDWGVIRSFFRCDSLPTLTTADVIVDAKVQLLSKRSGNTSLI